MSVGSVILTAYQERRSLMNLDEYKAYVEATRKASTMSVVSAIINSTKKEGSK